MASKQFPDNSSRRAFIKHTTGLVGLTLAPLSQASNPASSTVLIQGATELTLRINGRVYPLRAEPRTTLLDALREYLHLTGTKKGCDHGQCGACTVHVDGERITSCLTLAIMQQGKAITTIEGLSNGDDSATARLHPVQEAFLKHDGFQCGYCTPGQIMSAVACIREGHATSDDQCREWMSGNICRCGAYPNILAAIREVASNQ